jgi:hypothetical protein
MVPVVLELNGEFNTEFAEGTEERSSGLIGSTKDCLIVSGAKALFKTELLRGG